MVYFVSSMSVHNSSILSLCQVLFMYGEMNIGKIGNMTILAMSLAFTERQKNKKSIRAALNTKSGEMVKMCSKWGLLGNILVKNAPRKPKTILFGHGGLWKGMMVTLGRKTIWMRGKYGVKYGKWLFKPYFIRGSGRCRHRQPCKNLKK